VGGTRICRNVACSFVARRSFCFGGIVEDEGREMRRDKLEERGKWKVVGCLRSLGKGSAENSNGRWARSKYI
jgi:hypothetical protein